MRVTCLWAGRKQQQGGGADDRPESLHAGRRV